METTWRIVNSGSAHSIAAAFTLGRENLIPDMFRVLVTNLQNQFPEQLNLLHNYLERHIHLDEQAHTPMAMQMLTKLCNNDSIKWRECEEAARVALNARIALWNGVVEQMTIARTRDKRMVNVLSTEATTDGEYLATRHQY